MMRYFCCDERRQSEIEGRDDINGIAFLEVRDDPALATADRQRTLFVHFINPPTGLDLGPANVMIAGGERIRDLAAIGATIATHPDAGTADPVLVVEVDRPGDFSIYTLTLVEDEKNPGRLDDIDPILRSVDFSFKVTCDTDFDCMEQQICPPRPVAAPAIDYLARDFQSLRQVMLDRLAVLAPDWRERNVADLGVAMVEVLAYVGDYLSYRQDAIATEAYLDTAHQRISARRHARLVDYFMHDGCNARVWACFEVEGATVELPAGTQLLTGVPGVSASRLQTTDPAYRRALESGAVVFETMHPAPLSPALNQIDFYTWGGRECCLPKGATRATLRGDFAGLLAPGMAMVFEEVRNPRTGDAADADLRHRQAVRLTEVIALAPDAIGGRFDSPPTGASVAVTDIAWADEDALRFPLCISAETDEAFGRAYVDRVSVALGNVVLADHGRTLPGHEDLGQVPEPWLMRVPAAVDVGGADWEDGEVCRERRLQPVPARFRPSLARLPVTQAVPYDHTKPASAAATTSNDPGEAVPAILELISREDTRPGIAWAPKRDLLNSADRPEFAVEIDNDSRAFLRFGDGRHGARPPAGARFAASYRVGNGSAGNIGAETLAHIATADAAVLAVAGLLVRNPLPAEGGVDPESIASVRQRAPFAFRTQQRAVTIDDYADQAASHAGVQKAAATLRWTGSWHTHFIRVDRTGGQRVDPSFERDLRAHLEPFRLAGHDLEVDHPYFVGIDLDMRIAVRRDYFRTEVRRAVLELLSSRTLPDGRRGVFHPDNLTFGQTVHLSPIYAAAQNLDGVESVTITRFERRDQPGPEGLRDGKLQFGRLEIPRLDNDRSFPDRGTLRLAVVGGK